MKISLNICIDLEDLSTDRVRKTRPAKLMNLREVRTPDQPLNRCYLLHCPYAPSWWISTITPLITFVWYRSSCERAAALMAPVTRRAAGAAASKQGHHKTTRQVSLPFPKSFRLRRDTILHVAIHVTLRQCKNKHGSFLCQQH